MFNYRLILSKIIMYSLLKNIYYNIYFSSSPNEISYKEMNKLSNITKINIINDEAIIYNSQNNNIFEYKYIMSGTPMPQDRLDLKSQFGVLFPEKISKNAFYEDLKSIYVRTTKDDIGLKPFKTIYKALATFFSSFWFMHPSTS